MSFDTSAEAARAQAEVIRKLGPPGRIRLACQMSETVREFARARIRAQNPELNAAQIRDLLIWELYGDSPRLRMRSFRSLWVFSAVRGHP
jgi:hypothetical protein